MDVPVVRISRELESLVPRFLGNCSSWVSELRQGIAQSDLDVVRRIGHSLKGVGGGYGFVRITELGALMETAAKAGDNAAASAAIEALATYLDTVQVEYI